MSFFTLRNNIALLIVLILVVVLWVLLKPKVDNTTMYIHQNHQTSNDSSFSIRPSSEKIVSKSTQPKVDAKVDPTDGLRSLAGTPAEQEILLRWKIDRGYPDKSNTYGNYSEETLKKLADSGDIHAMNRLAEIYVDEEHILNFGRKAQMQLYAKAVLYGSTFAFLQIGSQLESDFDKIPESSPSRHSAALEILSNYEVAALRGDRLPRIVSNKQFIESNNIQLSDADKEFIKQRAFSLLNGLNEQRLKIGLPEFDNSVPDSVEKYFDLIESTSY